jgi:lactate dehydrogenase-like 2-hydroxyacid dehydrogenase
MAAFRAVFGSVALWEGLAAAVTRSGKVVLKIPNSPERRRILGTSLSVIMKEKVMVLGVIEICRF